MLLFQYFIVANKSNTSTPHKHQDGFIVDPPSIPVHNGTNVILCFKFFYSCSFVLDTSRDNEGIDHDSEPLRGNGRGSHEAYSQSNSSKEKNKLVNRLISSKMLLRLCS